MEICNIILVIYFFCFSVLKGVYFELYVWVKCFDVFGVEMLRNCFCFLYMSLFVDGLCFIWYSLKMIVYDGIINFFYLFSKDGILINNCNNLGVI